MPWLIAGASARNLSPILIEYFTKGNWHPLQYITANAKYYTKRNQMRIAPRVEIALRVEIAPNVDMSSLLIKI